MRGRGPPGEGEVPQGSIAGAGSLPGLQVAGFLLRYLQNGSVSKYSHIRRQEPHQRAEQRQCDLQDGY